MNLWSCLAPEGQSDRRDFTKSLMLWFVFSNKAASLISILADLWETARAMELAYWRWVFIQDTLPMPLSYGINISTFVFCWPFSGESFWLFCYLFQQAYYIYFMDLSSEPSPCESKLARKDHTEFVIHSGIVKWYQNTAHIIKYWSVHDVETEIYSNNEDLLVMLLFSPNTPLQFSLPQVMLGINLNGINSFCIAKWYKVLIPFLGWRSIAQKTKMHKEFLTNSQIIG